VVEFCHRHAVKAFVTLNTLVFTSELDDAADYLRQLNRAGVDALIVQDIGLVKFARTIVPDLAIHASTQMTVTSPEGASFAHDLGVERVVLARELSLRELEKFRPPAGAARNDSAELEVFVHGALCVAYSGQCLTSESLGRRSANRGECAQACRMPYELIVDGVVRDLGDKRYLLSPQDLAAVREIPALLDRGVISFKIEGRLKSPEYVAAVCQVYRRAIDAALAEREVNRTNGHSDEERYQLEMTFSRGLFTGWMHGVDHQRLVSARYGKKRGPFAGLVTAVAGDSVQIKTETPLAAGDGVVFDTGGDTNAEQGGRIYEIQNGRFRFGRGHIDFSKIKPGTRVWKTDDPALEKRLRQSFTGRIAPRQREPVDLCVSGRAGQPMAIEGSTTKSGVSVTVESALDLQAARTAPLTTNRLREHLGRFGDAPLELAKLENALAGDVILPIGELNRLRRELAAALSPSAPARRDLPTTWREFFARKFKPRTAHPSPHLRVLCRTPEQLATALTEGIREVYLDYEDLRRFADSVASTRATCPDARVFLATPRIQKAGEQGFFKLIENAQPDGVLIRNLGAIAYFHSRPHLTAVGDFSLNVANPLTAQHFIECGLDRLTISYDLNAGQVLELLGAAPPSWFELTLHQHMPMFHMEHCVFAAFLSQGSSHLDCGRPCDRHRVSLRDRVGVEHPLRADVGCRNTLFNAVPQTGAGYFNQFSGAGLRDFRIELLDEDADATRRIIRAYQALLAGQQEGRELWKDLNARSQLGVTRGTLAGE
ncbi:MAG: DUF3656 domain-containing protein, partial [Chthoniobacteraceae bacterium]